ncbi:MAG TPA: AAA family ATPase [Patescibacteria group bacterium]|nr:AAA family ATPase [Patescibacteria group bacterium]
MPDNLQRKKALQGDAEALLALTRDLLKPLPKDKQDAATGLLRRGWIGEADAAYAIGLGLLGRGNDGYFHPDGDFAALWLRSAAQSGSREAEKLLADIPPPDMDSYRDPFDELAGLIGLAAAKKAVAEQASRMAFMKLRASQGLPAIPASSLHLVFAGNPGTGKTSVARIFGRLLKQIGYLKSGHVVETGVPDIIGKWVGETPQKVSAKVAEALDGVLFIDEAYGLMGHTTHTGNSYGDEAITTLLKLMEDHRDRFVVIVAGYPQKMAAFLDYNPGLKSRFTEIIPFADYTPAEMAEIYDKFLRDGHYTLTPDARVALGRVMAEAPNLFRENFPNGRLVRNLFEDSVKYAASRVMQLPAPSRADLTTITRADLDQAFAELNQQQ